MSKRKISQQQQRRITTKQATLLTSEELSGLVIAHHGQSLEVEDANGAVIICKKRQHLGPIVPGDRVKWQSDPNVQPDAKATGVVAAIEPRTSLLSRPDTRDNLHAVAANVDQLFIIIAPTPAPNLTTIDRYLIAALEQNIDAILVLNKEDLLPNVPQQQKLKELLHTYDQIGVPTLIVSAKKLQHLDLIRAKMTNKTSVFVGQSGVGKSSIIEALVPDVKIRTGEISALTELGKHTTTTTRLYHQADLNADIIDSPGMREFPLWKIEPLTLAYGFIEFRPFLGECKFRNCIHTNEPGCALINAADNGKISRTRLASYQKIYSEMKCAR